MRLLRIVVLLCCSATLLFGCEDPKKVPEHIRKLQRGTAHEKADAAMSLGRIGAPEAVPAVGYLIGLLEDDNPGVQSAAAYALRKIDTPRARQALDAKRRFQK
jgi:HEAT repeat protein